MSFYSTKWSQTLDHELEVGAFPIQIMIEGIYV